MISIKNLYMAIICAMAVGTVSAQTQQVCTFTQPSFSVNFGAIVGPTVGKAQSVISLNCSNGLPVSISISSFGEQDGNIVSTYKDYSYTEPLTSVSPISINGTGSSQDIPLYFKLHRVPSGETLNGEYVILNTGSGSYSQSATLTIIF